MLRPTSRTRAPRRQPPVRYAALGLFFLLVGIYGLTAGGHLYSPDEEGMLLTTKMIVDEQTWTLPIDEGNNDVTSRRELDDDRAVGISGLAQSVAAIPFYVAGKVVSNGMAPEERELVTRVFIGWTNAFVAAVGALFFLAIARMLGASLRAAVALTLVYALCTYVWPNARHFMSEPIATTFALAAVYLTFRGRNSPRLLVAGGFVAGAGLLGRPSNGVFLVPLGLYVVVRAALDERRFPAVVQAAVRFGSGALVGIGLFMLTNWWRFGGPLDLGYQDVPYDTPLRHGLYGLFLSPGRSLFLFAPVTLVGLVAAFWVPRRHRPEVFALLGLAAANVLLFARFNAWHGDQVWGPRYMIMSTPFLALPVAAVLARRAWRRATATAAAVGLAFALIATVMNWNAYTTHVDSKIGVAAAPTREKTIWEEMRYSPYWSPLVGHFRLLDDVARNSWDLVDRESPLWRPVPTTVDERHFFYFYPPQLDSWWYYTLVVGPSRKLLVMAVPFLAALAFGAKRTVRTLRTADGEAVGGGQPPGDDDEAEATEARPTMPGGNGRATIEARNRS